jgi:hypothetical protein
MIHQPASQPRLTARRTPRLGWWAAGLTTATAAVLAGTPAALASPRPAPDGGGLPPPPPPVTAAAHLPLWAIAAIVAATVVLSVATTLITLSVERARQARLTLAAIPEPPAGHGGLLQSHHYQAAHDSYRAGRE